MDDDISKITKALTEKPWQIANELGTTSLEMNRLADEGVVIRGNNRSTGKRGRPPVEWGLPGMVIPDMGTKKIIKTVTTKDGVEKEKTITIPKLPDISAVRDQITGESLRKIEYIEAVFGGKYGPTPYTKVADYYAAIETYNEIVRKATTSSVDPWMIVRR